MKGMQPLTKVVRMFSQRLSLIDRTLKTSRPRKTSKFWSQEQSGLKNCTKTDNNLSPIFHMYTNDVREAFQAETEALAHETEARLRLSAS